jgi:hypothetical protein
MQNSGKLVFTRINSGIIFIEGKDGKRRAIKMATTGTLDIFILIQGQVILFETKKPGKTLSPEQKLFAEAWEKQGAKVFKVDDIGQAQVIIETILVNNLPTLPNNPLPNNQTERAIEWI